MRVADPTGNLISEFAFVMDPDMRMWPSMCQADSDDDYGSSQNWLQYQALALNSPTPIPTNIQKEIALKFRGSIQVDTYEDAAFLKQSILDGQENQDIQEVVAILEKGGIIPSGEDNLRFG